MASVARLVICGMGLIGGSVAAGARAGNLATRIIGVDADQEALAEARRVGLIDADGWPDALGPEDLVVIAVPTLSVPSIIGLLWREGRLASGATVTDVASVKCSVVDAARSLCGELPPNLVPGHPIAGSERSGVGAARADLFRDHRVILTPEPVTDPSHVAVVASLWQGLGAEVCRMTVAEHDRVLAMTSHLPHLLAFALVDSLGRAPEHAEIFRFAAGGFRDFTRIASSDPIMWSDIFAANASAVASALDHLEGELKALRGMLETGDRAALKATFSRAKALRDVHVGSVASGAATNRSSQR